MNWLSSRFEENAGCCCWKLCKYVQVYCCLVVSWWWRPLWKSKMGRIPNDARNIAKHALVTLLIKYFVDGSCLEYLMAVDEWQLSFAKNSFAMTLIRSKEWTGRCSVWLFGGCHDRNHECGCCLFSIVSLVAKKWLVWFTFLINSAVEPHINQISKAYSTNTSPLIGRHRRKQ